MLFNRVKFPYTTIFTQNPIPTKYWRQVKSYFSYLVYIVYPPIIIVALDLDYCDHTHHLGTDNIGITIVTASLRRDNMYGGKGKIPLVFEAYDI